MWTGCGGKIDGIQILGCADKEVGHCQDNLTWACKPDPETCDLQVTVLEQAANSGSKSGCWDATYGIEEDGEIMLLGTTKGSGRNYTDYEYAYHDVKKSCRWWAGNNCNYIKIEAAEKCESLLDDG